jgi:hypothetical protein
VRERLSTLFSFFFFLSIFESHTSVDCDLVRLLDYYAMPGRLLFASQLRPILPGNSPRFLIIYSKLIDAVGGDSLSFSPWRKLAGLIIISQRRNTKNLLLLNIDSRNNNQLQTGGVFFIQSSFHFRCARKLPEPKFYNDDDDVMLFLTRGEKGTRLLPVQLGSQRFAIRQ